MPKSFWDSVIVDGDGVAARDVPVQEIYVADRARRDMGDLRGLTQSLREIGMLNPLVVTSKGRLVCGERRLRAARVAGWKSVPCRVVSLAQLVQAEFEENSLRKDLTDSEKVALGKALEAELGERRGRCNTMNLPELKGRETLELAAKAAGFMNPESYRQARKVVRQGAKELVAALDANEVARADAAEIADLPPEEQAAVLKSGTRGVKAKVRSLKSGRKSRKQPKSRRVKFDGLRAPNKTSNR